MLNLTRALDQHPSGAWCAGLWHDNMDDPSATNEGAGLMPDVNKRNLVYFENSSMLGLYNCMEEWQHASNRRLLSISIQKDGGNYCCIALTNPAEVVITSADGTIHVDVERPGTRARLYVST